MYKPLAGIARGSVKGVHAAPVPAVLADSGGGDNPSGELSKPTVGHLIHGNVSVPQDKVSGTVVGGSLAGHARGGENFVAKEE